MAIALLWRRSKRTARGGLITEADNRFSTSKTIAVAWTLVVAWLVVAANLRSEPGVLRLHLIVPDCE